MAGVVANRVVRLLYTEPRLGLLTSKDHDLLFEKLSDPFQNPGTRMLPMGTSHGDFIKYPRTPHLFGSKGTDDDKHLGDAESTQFLADDSLIVNPSEAE